MKRKGENMKQYKASIIIPVNDNCTILEYFLEHLKITLNLDNYQLIFVVDGPVGNTLKNILDTFSKKHTSTVISYLDKKTCYAHVNNHGRTLANSDLLVFMNTDIFLQNDCLEILIESLYKNSVHAIQPLLIYPQNNLVQSTGHIFGDCYNRHALKGQTIDNKIVNISCQRQALSLALCIIRADIFDECNGFDEYYFNGWEGLDLTLKITQKNYICWYESKAKAYHIEGGSRKKDNLRENMQAGHFWSVWGKKVEHDIIQLIQQQLNRDIYTKDYVIYNFTTYRSWNEILKKLKISHYEIINKNIYSNLE